MNVYYGDIAISSSALPMSHYSSEVNVDCTTNEWNSVAAESLHLLIASNRNSS